MTKTNRDQLFEALDKLECRAEDGDLSNIGIADYDAFECFRASIREELDADDKDLRHAKSRARELESLLSVCAPILKLSGVKMSAEAGHLSRHGIQNAEQLDLFLGDIARVLGA